MARNVLGTIVPDGDVGLSTELGFMSSEEA